MADTRRLVAALLLLEEAEEEEALVASLFRKSVHTIFKQRTNEGAYTQLIKKDLVFDEAKFREYFVVSRDVFYFILSHVEEDITKKSSNRVIRPISAEEKLCITLRYMAAGESHRNLSTQFRVSNSYISLIIKETLIAITDKMLKVAMPELSDDLLLKVAEEFENDWQFPNCCGAMTGRHIRVKCPKNSGSHYESVVLFALVDAKCKFLAIDVGPYGEEGDTGLFPKSNLGKALANGHLPFPPPKASSNASSDRALPHVLLGDEAFQLTPHMMRPFPKEQARTCEMKAVFNSRLCRARSTSENAFGILSQYFRVFFGESNIAQLDGSIIDYLVTAACIIHNLLREENVPYPSEDALTTDHVTDFPKSNFIPLKSYATNATHEAYNIRQEFMDYFFQRRRYAGLASELC